MIQDADRDRRQSLVEITPRGVQLMEGLLPVLHRAERVFVDPALTTAQQVRLLGLLGRLQAHLATLHDGDMARGPGEP